jgi:hypothetical protein
MNRHRNLLIPVLAINAYEEVEVYLHIISTSTLDGGKLQNPVALPPGKYPPLPTELEALWTPKPDWMFRRRAILPVSEIDPRF